jgi:hypothetical protein
LAGLGVIVISFWITLMALRYFADARGAFAKLDFSTPDRLAETARSAGFTESTTIVGNIDGANRQQTGVLEAGGWALDRESSGNPVLVFVIVNGHAVLSAEPKGPRSDVAATLKLPPQVATDIAWSGTSIEMFSCGADRSAMGIAVNQKKQFAIITRRAPIAGC